MLQNFCRKTLPSPKAAAATARPKEEGPLSGTRVMRSRSPTQMLSPSTRLGIGFDSDEAIERRAFLIKVVNLARNS